MAVSKQHMEWVATYLAQNLSREEAADAERSITVQAFADFFAEFNPRFNKMRFAEAVRTRSGGGTRKGSPRRKAKAYIFSDEDIGQWIDGAFGDEHAINKMQDMLGDVVEMDESTGKAADLHLANLDDERDGENFDVQEWLDDATELLQDATASGLTWEWDGGDLILTQDVEREP